MGGTFGKVLETFPDFPKLPEVPTQYKNAVGGDFYVVFAPQAAIFCDFYHI